MEGQQFDHLTRQLTGLLPRRRIGRLLAAMGLGISLAPSLEAKKKKGKNKKPKKCRKGTIKCGKKCVNPQNNALNCGGCDQACAPGQACENGECTSDCDPPCPTGRPCVGGRCACTADPQCESARDPHGNFCIFTSQSVPGFCGCPSGWAVCATGEACSGCCDELPCTLGDPASEFICAGVPENSYWSRQCCMPTDAECGNNDDFCCSRRCNRDLGITGQCECAPAGSPCRTNIGCCSSHCLVATGKCA